MDDFAYFSVIEWPPALSEHERSEFLSRAFGMDRYLARQAVLRGAPQVVTRVDARKSARAVAAVRRRGGLAFSATEARFAELSAPMLARQLISGQGSTFMARPHRGDPLVFDAKDILVIVRASLRATESRASGSGPRPSPAGAYLLGGAAMAGLAAAAAMEGESGRDAKTTLTEVLDVHLRGGRSVRFDGRRFRFDVLPERGLTDRDNMDRLGVLLGEASPKAVVDTSFQDFRCPPDVIQSYFVGGPAGVRKRTQHGAFDFYSAWAVLMYTEMLG